MAFGKEDVLSVSGEYGVINQIAFQGRSFAGESVADYHVVETDDIVYTKSPLKANPYGIIKVNKGIPGIVSTLYAVYHPLNTVAPRFVDLYFANNLRLNKFLKPLVNIGAKHDMKVNNSFVLTGTVVFPSIGEQQKLVDFFAKLDRRIEAQRKIVEALKKYKRGAIQKLFSETDMEQWNLVKLKDVVKVFDGTHQTPNYKTTGVRFISVENILDPLATQKYISEDDYRKEFKVHPEYGDVLMTRIGDIGRTYYVNFDSDMAYYVSLALFKCSPKIEGRFLAAYISTNTFQKELWERTLHIAFPKKINTGEIGECSIRLPSRERQIAIASYLDVIEKKIRLAEKKLDLIQIIKTGLMQQLFI